MNKQKRKYMGGALFSLILAIAAISAAVLPAWARESEQMPSLNYGISGSETNTEILGGELYEMLFQTAPTEGEASYLAAKGITLTYHANLPDSLVSSEYLKDTGVLSLKVLPYSYTAENGANITWIPTRLTVDGREEIMTETDGVYTCRIENLFASADLDMQVEYTWEVEIPASAVEAVKTAPYEAGSAALVKIEEYEAKLKIYENQLADYEAWVAYTEWCEEYDRYCEELAAYDLAKAAYDAYLKEHAVYEQEMAKVQLWEKYYEDVANVSAQLDAYNRYLTYLDRFKKVSDKLALMESLYSYDSRGWRMYGSIMGNSVDTVMKNQDLLIKTLKVDADMVYGAGESTEVLRTLLPQYQKLREEKYISEHDRIEALYAFYTEHYEELGKQFKKLYISLKYLYEKEAFVRSTLQSEGKEEHYQQFVAQLYVISTCFDALGERDPNWKLYGTYRVADLVEPVHLLEDGDWDPANTPMPEKVAPVPPVKIPTPPEGDPPASRPAMPIPVENPGDAPVAPVPPHGDTVPSEAEHPGNAPVETDVTAEERMLAEEIRNGTLTPYDGSFAPTVLKFSAEVSRPISIRNLKTVSFYDHQNNLLDRFTVEYGSSLAFYRVPDRAPTAQYSYEGRGWVTFDGADADLSNITADLALRPDYISNLRSYTVTWILDGETESAVWSYGSTPTPPVFWPLGTYEQGEYRYTFSGWDQEVQPVSQDVTYKGEMIRSRIHYTVTWILYDGKTVVEEHPIFSVPVFSGDVTRPSDSYRYTFREWIGHGAPLTQNVTYYAAYDKVKLAGGGAGGSALPVTHADSEITVWAGDHSILTVSEVLAYAQTQNKDLTLVWENGYTVRFDASSIAAFNGAGGTRILLHVDETNGEITYRLRLRDADGNETDTLPAYPTVTLPYKREAGRETVFFSESAEGLKKVTELTVTLTSGMTVIQKYAYDFRVTPNKLCNTMGLDPFAVAGDTVSLNLPCIFGYEVVGAKVVTADGAVVSLSKDLTFIMPSSPVSVTLEVVPIRYTVTFLVDGEVWSSAEYALGDTILLPKVPTKAPETGYTYTFSTWGDVPSIASGEDRDMVFEAQFIKATENIDYASDAKGNQFLRIYLPVAGIILLIVAGGIVATVIILRKRSQKKANASASEEPAAPHDTDES